MIALIFDTETSGLVYNHTLKLNKQPEVIEFYGAVVDLATGEVFDEVSQLIKPAITLPEEQLKHTPISNEMLKDAPRFAEVADKIRTIIEGAPTAIAHNLSFDMEMIGIEFERIGQEVAWPPGICTVEQTVHLKGYRLGLTNLHTFLFGKPFDDTHRAKPDTEALIRCCIELFKRGML